MGLAELIDHIIATHHTYLRRQLPQAMEAARAAREAEPDRRQRLDQVVDLLETFARETEEHLQKEERQMFPRLVAVEDALCGRADHRGGVGRDISDLDHDHEGGESTLEELRLLTENFTAPAGASQPYRELVRILEAIEQDLRLHTVKETELFSRAVAVDAQIRRRTQ